MGQQLLLIQVRLTSCIKHFARKPFSTHQPGREMQEMARPGTPCRQYEL